MKNIKRVLCLVLTLLMVASTVSVFAAFSDVPTTVSYEKAVSALNQLGIIKGYDDGTFKPDNDVTRAEFTAMLMRTMGAGSIGSSSSADLPFSDVSDQDSDISWSIPNINTAYKNGIVNGYEDGTFRPNDKVAYEEAVKMVVCALGYGENISVDATPWYSNFMAQARSLGILKGAQNLGSAEKPASRACIAQMLYDSLEVSLVENGVVTTKTFLADYLGYIKNTGYISANDLTSLDDPDVNLRENQIQIRAKEPNSTVYEVHTYAVENAAEFTNKLGYQIDFFYPKTSSNDTIRTLFSYEIKENATLELNSSMIEKDESNNTTIKYYPTETSSLTNANLATDNIVIYNGKLYGSNADASRFSTDMFPNVGTITVLDSDKDGKYDVVTIWDYQVYYVSKKSTSDSSIVDNASRATDKTLTLDVDKDTNLEIVDKNGTKVSFSSISEGNVICYAVSNYAENGGEEYSRAVVVTDKATGNVSSTISGDEMSIGSNSYKFSDAAPWMENGNDGSLEEPKTGDNGTYALDILGNVFAYSKSNEVVNQYYGYVLAYDEGEATFSSIDDFQVRILTQNNSKTDFHIRKGTTVNGVSCSTAYDFLDALREGASYQKTGEVGHTDVQQVVKYTYTTYKGNQCIDTLYTVTPNTDVKDGQTVESDKLYNFANLERGEVSLKYANSKLSSGNIQLSVGSSIVFVVPPQDQRNDTDRFRKATNSYFSTNKTYDSVEAFDVSNTNSAKVVVVYGGSAATEVDDSSPIYVFNDKPSQQINADTSDTMYKVSGFKISKTSTNGTFDEWASLSSNSVVKNAQIGDIYRVGEDSDGFKTFKDEYRLYPADEGYIEVGSGRVSNWSSADFCVIYGSVYASDSSEGMVIIPKYIDQNDDVSGEDQYTISASSFSGAKILKYSENGGKTEIVDATSDKEAVMDGIAEYNEGLNPAKVLIYMSEGRVKLLAVTEGY